MVDNNGLTDIFKAYRVHYGLTQEAVEELAKFTNNKYSRIESGRQEPKAADTKAISKVYGLESYQMTNPKYPKPIIKKLPIETQKAILKIRSVGIQLRSVQNKIDLGKEIDKLIELGKLDDPITARELFSLLPEVVKNSFTKKGPSKVTDFLTRPPRNEIIKIVDRPEGRTDIGNWYQKIHFSDS